MLLVNGINIVQSFFVIGGFLTAFLFLTHVEKEDSCRWSLLFKAALLRYIRFAPLLLLMILLHSTWLYRFGDGPFWDKINFAERQFCRTNWWTNMLFVDNYVEVEQKCLIQRFVNCSSFESMFWLLLQLVSCCRLLARIRSSFHLDFNQKVWLVLMFDSLFFIFFMFRSIFFYFLRKPSGKSWIFALIFGVSAIMTAFVTYFNKFDPIAIFPPEWVTWKLAQK